MIPHVGVERTLSSAELAKEFGLTRRAAINWVAAGCPHDDLGRGRGRGKRFNLLEVKQWVHDTGRRLSHGGGPMSITPLDDDGQPAVESADVDGDEFDLLEHKQQIAVAKLRKELAMAKKYELDVEIKKENLIPKEEVERGRLERIAFARARLIGGPSILAPDLAHESLEVIENALNEWVAEVLNDLAGGETPTD